jgi:hypothetical protein
VLLKSAWKTACNSNSDEDGEKIKQNVSLIKDRGVTMIIHVTHSGSPEFIAVFFSPLPIRHP